jgi:hypothetical protein
LAERLAQGTGGVGERVGDLGVGLQGVGDLAEVLGAGAAERGDHLAELGELGAHLGVHLVEAGVDHVLLRRQGLLRRGLLAGGERQRPELLALEDGGLLERSLHRSVALGHRLVADLCHRVLDRCLDRELHRDGAAL